MWPKILLALPVVLVIAVSGCTTLSAGGLCIPGIYCTTVNEEASDVYTISALSALPSTVSPGQDMRLIAIVENVATRPADSDSVKEYNVQVELYDYCAGLFTIKSGTEGCTTDGKCTISKLLPGEKREISWTLTASEKTKLQSKCTFKVLARYAYATRSTTNVYLIDYAEMQRQLNQGGVASEGEYISTGYGPIKPYLTVEDEMPIPVPSDQKKVSTVFGFQIKNTGSGFLVPMESCSGTGANQGDSKDQSIGIKSTDIAISSNDQTGTTQIGEKLTEKINELSNQKVYLIGDESPKLILQVDDWDVGNIPIKATKVIEVSLNKYCYEFRKELAVEVQPKV